MLARVRAVSIVGLDAFEVEVETDLRLAIPRFVIVGLPDASLKESQERVESAIVATTATGIWLASGRWTRRAAHS